MNGTLATVGVFILLNVAVCRMNLALAGSASQRQPTWGRVLIVGEEQEGNGTSPFVAELYDPALNRFVNRPPRIKMERIGATATVIPTGPDAGKVLVAGGYSDTIGPLTSTELYAPAIDRFVQGPDMRSDLVDHTATVIPSGPQAGNILLIGPDSYAELYDPLAKIFTEGPRLAHIFIGHTATIIPIGPNAGKILLAGGGQSPDAIRHGDRGVTEKDEAATTELYVPATNTVVRGPKMNIAREYHTATVILCGTNAGKILLVGGQDRKFRALASTELYDSRKNEFAAPGATANMSVPRAFHTATVIHNGPNTGKILIAGGQTDDHHSLSSTELYDPLTNRFVSGPEMHSRRSQHVAIPIAYGPNKGKILIAAGVDVGIELKCDEHAKCSEIQLSSTELYDPITNAFEPGPSMYDTPGRVVAVQLPAAPPAR